MAQETIRYFKDATAIITGGASGIGRALAEELSRRGAHVFIADRQCSLAQDAAASIEQSGGTAAAVELDVTDAGAFQETVSAIHRETGRLDFLFNNAGIAIGGEAKDFRIEDWNRIIDVNFNGVVYGVQAGYMTMVKQGFGHIINTASMAGLGACPLGAAYAATKHAVVGLTTSLRAEAAAYGVRVSVLCPGAVQTPILEGGEFGKIMLNLPKEQLQNLWKPLHPMSPAKFARKTVAAVRKNRSVIIVPWWWRMLWLWNRMMPRFSQYLARKAVEDVRRKVTRAAQKQK